MIRKAVILFSVTAAVGAAAGFVATRGGSAGASAPDALKGNFSIAQAQAFTDYPLYNAGSSLDDMPLAVFYDTGGFSPSVSFIYGDCQATDDMGCAPPVQVQVWPACIRNPSLYESSRPGALTPEPTSVRGVPAAFFEDGHRLEIQTGTSTVVVFARSRDEVLQVASALRGVNVAAQASRGVNVAARASEALPPPAAGALDGTLKCG